CGTSITPRVSNTPQMTRTGRLIVIPPPRRSGAKSIAFRYDRIQDDVGLEGIPLSYRSIRLLQILSTALVPFCLASSAAADTMERIEGKPNRNGVWQALGTAHWNLEGHSAEALPEFWRLGAIGAIPAGRSVVVGGEIPYLPEALAMR